MSAEPICGRCQRRVAKPRQGSVHCPYCGLELHPPGAELALRPDLVIEAVPADGPAKTGQMAVKVYVIKDPRSNRYFRIQPLEYFLITQFDGQTTYEEIRRRASEEKRVLVSQEVLSRFAQKFVDLGLLRNVSAKGAIPEPTAQASSIFRVKIPLANPERLLDRVYPPLRLCFTTGFVAFMWLAIAAASMVLVLNLETLAFGLSRVSSLEGLTFVILTVTAVSLLHELAHGLCCRHFDGRVSDMGFLLLYFLPCFYCNVSDTYFFTEKRKRFWVFFSGGFFELFIWALSLLAWRIVAPETWISRVLFVIVSVSGLRTLFNFNPLIKMDGYYLLADHLGIANLRKEALAGLGRGFRRLFGLSSRPPLPEIRERRILAMSGERFLVVFGAAAVLYTVGLVSYLAYHSGEWLFNQYGSDGLGLFTLAMVGLLHKPAVTAASAARDASREKWAQLKTRKRRSRFVILWALVLLGTALFPWQLRIPSELEILPQQRETVRAPAAGRVAKIHFSEGERVSKGDVLLEYDTKELLLEQRTKQAELVKAQEELRLLEKQNPTFREEIQVEERALTTSRAQEQAARQDFQRDAQLFNLGLISKDAFEKTRSELEEAEAKRGEVEAQIALVRKASPDSRNEQMEVFHLRDPGAQRAVIEKLDAELAQLEDQLSRTRVVASISGTLTTYRFREKMGEFLEEGAEVCEIANDEQVVVEMPVSEKEIDAISLGQTVKFKVRGYPSRRFEAVVAEIAPVAIPAGPAESISRILIRAHVDNKERLLKPGMTGVAKIYCGMSFVANVLTRDLIRFVRTEFWF